MMNILITKTVKVKWNNSNKKYYDSKGYKFTKVGDEFDCRVEDLNKTHKQKINVLFKCDCKLCNNIEEMSARKYFAFINKHNKIYCNKHYYKYYNTYTSKEDYTELKVNNSNCIYKISNEDVEFAQQYVWHTDKSKRKYENGDYPYLIAKEKINNKWTHVKYHDKIMKDEIEKYKKEHNYNKKVIVDHISAEVNDNRRSNLRVRTQSENNMNKEVQCNNTTSVVGVFWHSRDKIWSARIGYNGKQINLGSFYYMRNAVKARIEAEIKYFGEHALRERENNTYKEYIDYILSLPSAKEPIIKQRPNNEFNILGIRRKKNNKFIAYIHIKELNKKISKTFYNLQDAIQWRKEKEKEILGQEIMYNDEKQEKLI